MKIKNWEALSVIGAMLIFIGNMFFQLYMDYSDKQEKKNNVRIMLVYEINNNNKIFRLLEATKNAGFDKEDYHIEGQPFPTDVDNAVGGVRVTILSGLKSEIFDSYIKQIGLLDKDEVIALMEYYKNLNGLKNKIELIRYNLKNKDKIELKGVSFALNLSFQRVNELSAIILNRYSYLLAIEDDARPE